jgi:general stress protein YciG
MTKRIPISKVTGKPKQRRGFAAMDPERRREIARKGGAAVPAEKRSFHRDRELAASAGAKGGEASRAGGRTLGSRNRAGL